MLSSENTGLEAGSWLYVVLSGTSGTSCAKIKPDRPATIG